MLSSGYPTFSMRSSYNVLFLGLWLMGQSWGSVESYPEPSISVYPNETVALGGTVNIRCRSDYERPPEGFRMLFYLQKQVFSDFEMWRNEVAERDEVVFPIVNATPSDAGLYRCIYCFQRHNCEAWSLYSNRVNISVRDINESVLPVGTYIRLGAASMVLLALMLIVAEAVYSWRNVSK